MKLKVYLISILFSILVCQVISAEDTEVDEDAPKACHSYIFDLLTNGLKVALKCMASFKPNRITEYVTRIFCIIKCVLREFGTIDDEGNIDAVQAGFFFDETFAPEVKDVLVPAAQDCFALADKFDGKDYWCKSYSPFVTCIIKAAVPVILPYAINCFVSPIIGIALDVLNHITPGGEIAAEVETARREYYKKRGTYCHNKNCTTKYRMNKSKGVTTMILYYRNMTEFARIVKGPNGFQNYTATPIKEFIIESTNDTQTLENVFEETISFNSTDCDNNNTLTACATVSNVTESLDTFYVTTTDTSATTISTADTNNDLDNTLNIIRDDSLHVLANNTAFNINKDTLDSSDSLAITPSSDENSKNEDAPGINY